MNSNIISFKNVFFKDAMTGAMIENASFEFAMHEHHAVLCTKAPQRKALVQLISGQSQPDNGTIILPSKISFPIGSVEVLHVTFSVKNNAKILARLYGLYSSDILEFVNAIIERDYNPETALNKLSQKDKTDIQMALSYAIPFDCYLANQYALPINSATTFDNLLGYIEDLNTQKKGLLLVTESPMRARESCTKASILDGNTLLSFSEFTDATKQFRKIRGPVLQKARADQDVS